MSLSDHLLRFKILFEFSNLLNLYVVVRGLLVEIFYLWFFALTTYRTYRGLFWFKNLGIDVWFIAFDLSDDFDLFFHLLGPVLDDLFSKIVKKLLNEFFQLLKIIPNRSKNLNSLYFLLDHWRKLGNEAPHLPISNDINNRSIKSILSPSLNVKITLNSFHNKKRLIIFPKKWEFCRTQWGPCWFIRQELSQTCRLLC